jgi:hypothetical protein
LHLDAALLFGAILLLGNINDSSPDKSSWMTFFAICLVIGAPISWLSVKTLLYICNDWIKHAA